MTQQTGAIPPMVDFSRIPAEYEGRWLVLNREDQAILGSGYTLREALHQSKRRQDDPAIVLARVPVEPVIFVVQPDEVPK